MITPILLCTYHDQTRLIDNQLTIKIDYTHAFLKSARIEHNRPVGGCRAPWLSGSESLEAHGPTSVVEGYTPAHRLARALCTDPIGLAASAEVRETAAAPARIRM